MADVGNFLEEHGMEALIPEFMRRSVDGEQLLKISPSSVAAFPIKVKSYENRLWSLSTK
jgi:hypothetical protein